MTPPVPFYVAMTARLALFAVAVSVVMTGLAGCNWPEDDNAREPHDLPPVTRVLSFHYAPENPAAGDTVRLHVVTADAHDKRLEYLWSDVLGSRYIADGRPNGPRVRVVAPDTLIGVVSINRPDDPRTQGIVYRFTFPTLARRTAR